MEASVFRLGNRIQDNQGIGASKSIWAHNGKISYGLVLAESADDFLHGLESDEDFTEPA
jgi:hypothetical protein